jgi:hypothetical protein
MDDLLSRGAASAAVSHLGWRYLLGTLRTSVRVGSLAQAATVAARAPAFWVLADAEGNEARVTTWPGPD